MSTTLFHIGNYTIIYLQQKEKKREKRKKNVKKNRKDPCCHSGDR